MAEKTTKKQTWKRWLAGAQGVARVLTRFAASRTLLWLLMLIAVVAAGWLAYAHVWRPLQQEVQLPPTVPATNPKLERTLLQELANGLTIRRRHTPASYFRASSVFISSDSAADGE